jgi:hypothetical protein
MPIHRIIFSVIVAVLALAAPARATDTHDYAKGEYAIIRDGLSPDKTRSLASHGEGEGGGGEFHVWLMAEPGHRRLAPLDDIGENNNLDTGPDAYHAVWSKDSRYVAVGFRSDRHVVELNLYRVEPRRMKLISGPSLFREVAGRNVGAGDDLRQSIPVIQWTGERRFLLRENRLFKTADAGFAGRLGHYGKVTDKLDDGNVMVEFAAEADCVLMSGNHYRVVDLRVGKPVE